MKKYYVIILFSFFLMKSCVNSLDKLSYESEFKRTVSQIKSEYKGVIIEKYSPRNTPPTHIKILTSSSDTIDVSPNENIIKEVSIGDSIFKIRNENLVEIKNSIDERKIFFYMKISKAETEDERYPKEWKGKWSESIVND